jgi:hypothetical protein
MKWLKWPLFLLVALTVVIVLLRVGFFEECFGPWAAWAKWIGYFG